MGLGVFLFFTTAFIFSYSPAEAAPTGPSIFTYQGKLLSSANAPISTAVMMKFVLYDSLTDGAALYSAAGTPGAPTAVSITPSSGIFSVNLGGTDTNPVDSGIFRDNPAVYLEVTVGAETLTPRKQITASPYAFNALYLDGQSLDTNSTTAYIPLSDDQGNFRFNNITSTAFFVTGTSTLATTTINSSTITNANVTNLTVNGTVSFLSNSLSDAMIPDTITASNYLLLAGGTLGGDLAFGGNDITGLNDLSLNGTLTNSGLTLLAGGFIASASSTVNAQLNVQGPLSASSTLVVAATSTFATGVGIATSSPLAALTIQDGSILAVGSAGGTPYQGPGTRLMWVPNKAAFRAGYVNGSQWDAANIGIYSTAFGENNQVSGDRAFAGGAGNTVSQTASVAFGGSNTVSVTYSGAFGLSNIINGGGGGFAFGMNNTVSGASSAIALGTGNSSAGGSGSTAIGSANSAGGTTAIALGSNMSVSGNNSVGIGLDTNNRTLSRNNTLAIMGGNVGIGTLTPGYLLSVSGTLAVSATSTFVTTTAVSSTIETANIASLFANTATITSLTVTNCTGCGGGVSLAANQTFTGLNTFAATTTLATTTIGGSLTPSTTNFYDLGTSSTQWRYLNVYGGVFQADGVTTSSLEQHQLILGQAVGYDKGKFYIDASGNISASGSLRLAGNVLPSARPSFTVTARTTSTLSSVFDAGGGGDRNISMVINADGFPIVAFTANANDLRVVKCGNADCSAGNIDTVVAVNDVIGQSNSMALGSDGLPVIAYQGAGSGSVHVIHCGNLACSSGNTTTDVNGSNQGTYLSLAIGIDGMPGIAVFDVNNDVRYIKCLNLTCSASQDNPVDVSATISTGHYISLAIANNGYPMMAYYNPDKTSLDYALCGDPACSDRAKITTTTVDNTADQGQYVSLAVGSDGLPVMSYRDPTFNRLIVTRCFSMLCNGATDGAVLSSGDYAGAGIYSSIEIGVDGFPLVAHRASGIAGLMMFKCNSVGCLSPTSTVLDTQNSQAGWYPSLAIGADGVPIVAYFTDVGNGELHFLKCAGYDCGATTTPIFTGGSNLGTTENYFNNVYANQFWGKKFKVAAFDVAEEYPTLDATLVAGEVVAFDENAPGYVKRATDSNKVIGIISTKPGLLLSEWENDASNAMQVPVALSGRVPLRVRADNGAIYVGDYLQLSAIPGVAEKSSGDKPTIGIAMDVFEGVGTGSVMTFVNLDASGSGSVYNSLTASGQNDKVIIGTTSTPYSLELNGNFSVVDPSLARLTFSTTTLLTINVPDFENAKALILNAPNFTPNSAPDRILFSLRSQDIPVFSVSANGDVNALGNYYGQSATFGSSTNPGDLAERVDIAGDDQVEAGDVMIVDPNSPDTYRRSNSSYDQAVAGVISSNPTIVVGRGKTDYTANLAMVGRVPVKVNNQNGSIARGDLLVASAKTGEAMKYDPALDVSSKMVGVIGIALDPLTAEQGKVMALIRTGWAYSQTKTLADLQTTIESVLASSGEGLGADLEKIGVESSAGNLGYSNGDLNLGGNSLLGVSVVRSKNNTWEIDGEGRMRAKSITVEQVITGELVVTPGADPKKTTIGEAMVAKGQTSVVVENAVFTTTTKIFITFVDNPKHFWWVSKKEAGAFTVSFDAAAADDAVFDYWLIPTTAVDNLTVPPSTAVPAPEAPPDIPPAESEGGITTSTLEEDENNAGLSVNSTTSTVIDLPAEPSPDSGPTSSSNDFEGSESEPAQDP